MLIIYNYFDKIRLPFENVCGSLDGLFGDSDHRFSGLSVPGSAKWGGQRREISRKSPQKHNSLPQKRLKNIGLL